MPRGRWLVVGAVVLVGLITAGMLLLTGRGLRREVTVDPGGRIETLQEIEAVNVVFDGSATDTAYLSFVVHDRTRLVAVRADSDEPLWDAHPEGVEGSVELAVADGALLVLSGGGVIAVDPETGKELWASSVLASDVMGDAGGYVVISAGVGVTGLDLRTGRVVWRFGSERDHVRLVPGGKQLVHYSEAGTLRLVDIATGRTEREVDVQTSTGEVLTELFVSADAVVVKVEDGSTLRSTVYASTDLSELWSTDGVVHPIGSDRFYVGNGTVADRQGRQMWRAEKRVYRTGDDTGWVFSQTYENPDSYRTRYFELATGRQLADGLNAPAHAGREGVLEVDSVGRPGMYVGTGRSMRLWYVELPSGDRTDLGTLEVIRETCAFSTTHLACLDTGGRFGLWSYT